ncbi:NAD-dependent epimerase/dehydratase family protein [Methylocella sp.]|uniref:NAD-dependent epimerase/dehydratase family protein n=1 Tax=Methylocella sp. TaxID=1978226 RepID=UPI003783AC08
MDGKILVTGAGGFLGRALVPALLARGASVTALGRGESPFAETPRLDWRRLDLCDPAAPLRAAAEGAGTVFHLAWSTVPAEAAFAPSQDARENIVGALRLIENLDASQTPRFVFASSGGAIYGRLSQRPAPESHPRRPISAYGVSKMAVEAYLDIYAGAGLLRPVSLRVGNLYGPGQDPRRLFGAVTQFSRAALAGEPIVMFGDGSAMRDYVYLDDAVDALIRAAGAPETSPALNVASGRGRSLNDLVATLERLLGRRLAVERRPARAFDAPVSELDCEKAAAELGWRARTAFEDGVGRTLAALARDMESLA